MKVFIFNSWVCLDYKNVFKSDVVFYVDVTCNYIVLTIWTVMFIMLWSQIIYGHRTASFSPNIVRFYGARTAPGRQQEESYDFEHFLDIVRCPVKFMYYCKFDGARTAFGRVIEGKMTSAGHRTVPRWRPAGACTHRTCTGRFLFNKLIVLFQRCSTGQRTVLGGTSYDVWQAPRTFKNLLTNRPMPVRAPDDARAGTG